MTVPGHPSGRLTLSLVMVCALVTASASCEPSPLVSQATRQVEPSTAVLTIEAFDAGPRDSVGNFLAFDPSFLLRETGGQSAAILTAIVFTIAGHDSLGIAAKNCIADPIVPAGATWDTTKITYYCKEPAAPMEATTVAVNVTFTDEDGRPGYVRAQLGQ